MNRGKDHGRLHEVISTRSLRAGALTMPNIKLKSVYRVVSKGRTYYYAWKGRGAPRLRAEYGSDAFVEELADALAQRKLGDASRVSGLVIRYRSSDDYCGLADTTKRNWDRWLDRITEHFGPLSLRQFDRPQIRVDIRKWRDSYKGTPRSADYGLQVLSRIMSFAVAEGRIGLNPVAGVPHIYRNDRSDLIWTDAQLAAVLEHASPEVGQAARLAALTGIREADLLKLGWSHVGDPATSLAIEFKTGKSRGRRTTLVPIYGELRALLKEVPRRATTVLTNTRGRPWSGGAGFWSSWNDAVQAAIKAAPPMSELRAELGERHFHDFRGTAATKLYSSGLSAREIAEILGWSEDRVERLIDRYVKRDELLRERIRRLDQGEASANARS